MATPHEQLHEQADKLIKLEKDFLINENVAVLDELESVRSQFKESSRLAVDEAIREKSPPDVYKVWFEKLHDDLCRAAGDLSCPFLAHMPADLPTEFRDSEFTSNNSRFWNALTFLTTQLEYDLHSDRKQLRVDITFGREFPQTEFLRELLRAFGPLDRDLDTTANRLLPYYPMPKDVSAVILANASEEKPTAEDWFILLFALADHAAMAFRIKPTLVGNFEETFDSEQFFSRFVDAISSASVVTPGFTGPSLPDKHEKLDEQVILGIRAWAADRLALSVGQSDMPDVGSDASASGKISGSSYTEKNERRERAALGDVERVANDLYGELKKINNKAAWGRKIGEKLNRTNPVDSRTVVQTEAWKKAEAWRNSTMSLNKRIVKYGLSPPLLENLTGEDGRDTIESLIDRMSEVEKEKVVTDPAQREVFCESVQNTLEECRAQFPGQ
jgi:hypothetical protein